MREQQDRSVHLIWCLFCIPLPAHALTWPNLRTRSRLTAEGETMSYLVPAEFVTKMVDAGESKVFMSTKDTVIRAYMAGAILALAAVFAVTINQQTGVPIVGAALFPVGFCML